MTPKLLSGGDIIDLAHLEYRVYFSFLFCSRFALLEFAAEVIIFFSSSDSLSFVSSIAIKARSSSLAFSTCSLVGELSRRMPITMF